MIMTKKLQSSDSPSFLLPDFHFLKLFNLQMQLKKQHWKLLYLAILISTQINILHIRMFLQA